LLTDPGRPTTVKTRIIAQHQQVVRFDRESRESLDPSLRRQALRFVERTLRGVNAVVFEDYGKGLIQQEFLEACLDLARRAGVLTMADPNAHHFLEYRGLTGITPNRHEAFGMAREPLRDPAANPLADPHLLDVGRRLLEETGIVNVLITLGEQGMCLFRAGHKPHHIPTAAQEVFDVSGAGDTAVSAFTLALSAGVESIPAAHLSNVAAGIVVGKAGTATVTPGELLRHL